MEKALFLRKVEPEELDVAFGIIRQGREYLKTQGLDQWQGEYPNRESVRQDLASRKGYFLTDGVEVMAYMCLDFDGEPAYREIQGAWLTGEVADYLVIHRLAFDSRFRGQGLSGAVFSLAAELCREARAAEPDTDVKMAEPGTEVQNAASETAARAMPGGPGVRSIRVDTDPANQIMQKALERAGFVYCGRIWFAGGDKLAYEKIL